MVSERRRLSWPWVVLILGIFLIVLLSVNGGVLLAPSVTPVPKFSGIDEGSGGATATPTVNANSCNADGVCEANQVVADEVSIKEINLVSPYSPNEISKLSYIGLNSIAFQLFGKNSLTLRSDNSASLAAYNTLSNATGTTEFQSYVNVNSEPGYSYAGIFSDIEHTSNLSGGDYDLSSGIILQNGKIRLESEKINPYYGPYYLCINEGIVYSSKTPCV